jgi:hypothetical protein
MPDGHPAKTVKPLLNPFQARCLRAAIQILKDGQGLSSATPSPYACREDDHLYDLILKLSTEHGARFEPGYVELRALVQLQQAALQPRYHAAERIDPMEAAELDWGQLGTMPALKIVKPATDTIPDRRGELLATAHEVQKRFLIPTLAQKTSHVRLLFTEGLAGDMTISDSAKDMVCSIRGRGPAAASTTCPFSSSLHCAVVAGIFLNLGRTMADQEDFNADQPMTTITMSYEKALRFPYLQRSKKAGIRAMNALLECLKDTVPPDLGDGPPVFHELWRALLPGASTLQFDAGRILWCSDGVRGAHRSEEFWVDDGQGILCAPTGSVENSLRSFYELTTTWDETCVGCGGTIRCRNVVVNCPTRLQVRCQRTNSNTIGRGVFSLSVLTRQRNSMKVLFRFIGGVFFHVRKRHHRVWWADSEVREPLRLKMYDASQPQEGPHGLFVSDLQAEGGGDLWFGDWSPSLIFYECVKRFC